MKMQNKSLINADSMSSRLLLSSVFCWCFC